MPESALHAQDVTVTAAADSSHITIGDWFRMTIDLKKPDGVTTHWPLFQDSLGPFEIVKQDSLLRTDSNGVVKERKTITISKYDSGSFSIPSIPIGYTSPGDTTLKYAATQPLPVFVSSIAVDTSRDIKDVKAPLSVPITWREILVYVLIVLAVIGIIYALYYYRKKNKKIILEDEEVRYERPAHIVAIERLRQLEEKRLWQKGEVKKFYSEATEIIREYFEKRYGIMALELTSDEVLQRLAKFKLEGSLMKSIESLFLNADLVKFAKYMPVSTENEAVIPQTLQIVDQSKQSEEEAVTDNV